MTMHRDGFCMSENKELPTILFERCAFFCYSGVQSFVVAVSRFSGASFL